MCETRGKKSWGHTQFQLRDLKGREHIGDVGVYWEQNRKETV